jgi:S-formylglutathione hydrolase FrmB
VARRCAVVLAALSALTGCASVVNGHAAVTIPRGPGSLVRRSISGAADNFTARPAYIYIPAAARVLPRRLPVLLLLHGTPGGPDNWPSRGGVAATANAFAAAHGGLAPVIVMPDINGTHRGDTECIRTPTGGDVQRYLQVTVPQWVTAHVPAADPNRSHWAIAGLSEGGTCAAMLALTRPDGWAAFADFSGLAQLTIGRYDSAALARRELFDGSQRAFDEHDPTWLLSHGAYQRMAAWFECGDRETGIRRQQAALARAAVAAGIRTRYVVSSGRHAWPLWTAALRQALPWLWAATKT